MSSNSHEQAMNLLKIIQHTGVRWLERLLILLMGLLVLDVLWQVTSRFVIQRPSQWTDELATLIIIWVAMIGASVAFIRGQHLGMDYFMGKCSRPFQDLMERWIHFLVAVFALMILMLGGVRLVTLTLLTEQLSPALGVKMGYVYLAIPLSGVVIFLNALAGLFKRSLAYPSSSAQTEDKR